MIIRARAPLRISFCGGGTDITPYPEQKGGVALSVTIDKFAYVSLQPRDDERLVVKSLDYNITARYKLNEQLIYDGELDLVKAVVKSLGLERGVDLFLHSDATPGSGLGSSSSMMVALLGVFNHWLRRTMTAYEVAELAYFIERKSLGSKGGRQDQFASAFGGFNFMEFEADTTIVNPLRVRPEIFNELHYHLLLVATGEYRSASRLQQEQLREPAERSGSDVDPLDTMKEITLEMKKVLLREQLDSFGALLHEAWLVKQRTHKDIASSGIEEIYEAARERGATGGKVLGAPGSGSLLLYCAFDKKQKIAKYLVQKGAEIVPFHFEAQGLQTWDVK